MGTRLISASKSEIRQMDAMELKKSIANSEGRVILSQCYIGCNSLAEEVTNAELAEVFGADMVFFNGYPMDDAPIPGLEINVFENGGWENKQLRLNDLKQYMAAPLGVYLECGLGDDRDTSTTSSQTLVRDNRIASETNLLKLKTEKVDFVVLAGNPGTGTKIAEVIKATKRAKEIVGDDVMIWAGKWEDGVTEKVLGDPCADYDSIEIISQLIDAGADCICLPMPGSRTGITTDTIRDLVTHIHTYKPGTLAMSFLDGSVEGADIATIRACTIMSKQTGADIHAIGDAGLSGMAAPENIYQMAITTKGRRLTFRKLGAGKR